MIDHANDAIKYFWPEHSTTKSIRPKFNGSSLMVSGFSCQCHSWCRALPHISWCLENIVMDIWPTQCCWNSFKVSAIPISDAVHPGKTLLFEFDSRQNYHTSWTKRFGCRKLLKTQVMNGSSTLNLIVSWITLNCYGRMWKDTFEANAAFHILICKRAYLPQALNDVPIAYLRGYRDIVLGIYKVIAISF